MAHVRELAFLPPFHPMLHERVEDDMISLANGCVCCQVRDDLVDAIDQLLAQPKPVDYVLLEASGVADPGSIYLTFADPKYQQRIRVDSIICVVDAEQVFNEEDPEPVALLKLRQIGFADLLIINKTDLAGEKQVARVREWVNGHLNRVRIVEALHCDVPLEILLGVGRFDPGQAECELAKTRDSADVQATIGDHGVTFARWSFETDEPLSLDRLREMVQTQLPAGVYRCKGIVQSTDDPSHRSVLQVVGRRCEVVQERAWENQTPTTRIVAIGSPGKLNNSELHDLFDSCIAGRVQKDSGQCSGITTVRI